MDSQIKAQDLAATILSCSTPPQISAAISAVESHLQKLVPEQTRSFFSIAFPALICKLFGFDDSPPPPPLRKSSSHSQSHSHSSAWIDQIHPSSDPALFSKLFHLLSPSGILLSSISSVDRHSLVKFIFPPERLPDSLRLSLHSDRLSPALIPPFQSRLKLDPISSSPQLHLNVFDYYIFWFAYYSVSRSTSEAAASESIVVSQKNRRSRLETWASSFPVLAASARSPGNKNEPSLYLRLLFAYLHAFVPNLNACQPYRSSLLHYSSGHDGSALLQAEFVVHTLVHFWLVDNDFSPLSVKVCRSLGMLIPFRAVLGETPPPAGLGDAVMLLLKHLNGSWVDGKQGQIAAATETTGSPRWKLASGFASRGLGLSVGSWNSVIQRPLYRFILRTFLFCPMGTSIKNASQVFSVWISYLEPWKISSEDFAKFDVLDHQSSNRNKHDSSQSLPRSDSNKDGSVLEVAYTPSWEGYVVQNYLFYSSLVVHFLGFAHKFLHTNAEMIIQMVLQVLNVLTSSKELMDLLQQVHTAYGSKPVVSNSAMFDTSYKYLPSIREQLQDWEDGLCESDADGSFLHENWNCDLRLFSEGEDGGHQLLQLLILRAEHELGACNGDNLSQNLQALDSLKAQMRCLFGESAGKLPRLSMPSPTHSQQGRDEVFTPKHPGVGQRTWADVKYKGDWMKRPISDGEVAWLARLLVRLSDWFNENLGLEQQGESSTLLWSSSSGSYVEVPVDDACRVDGLKEVFWAVLSTIGLWVAVLGQMVVGFMRKHGLRINLRVLASKKIVMIVVLYVFASLLKRIMGLCSRSP